jgi:hypothetical protein
MYRSRLDGAIPKRGEEAGDRFPYFFATGEAAPLRANQANQPVTFVDGQDEIFVGLIQPIHEQSLNIARHLPQRRVLLNDLLP